jgi:hypothetical protein
MDMEIYGIEWDVKEIAFQQAMFEYQRDPEGILLRFFKTSWKRSDGCFLTGTVCTVHLLAANSRKMIETK